MNNILTYSYDEVPCNLLKVINGVHTQVTGYSALLFKLFDKEHFFSMEFCPNVGLVQTGDVSVAKADKNLRTITILPRKFTLASQWF